MTFPPGPSSATSHGVRSMMARMRLAISSAPGGISSKVATDPSTAGR